MKRTVAKQLDGALADVEKRRQEFLVRYPAISQRERKAQMDQYDQTAAQLPKEFVVEHTIVDAVIENIFQPTKRFSSGRILMGSRKGIYPNPQRQLALAQTVSASREIPMYLISPRPGQVWMFALDRVESFFTQVMRSASSATWLITELYMFIGMPLGFFLLPVSRARARVRWRHIVRVGVYSLWIPAVMAFAVFALGALSYTIIPVDGACSTIARVIVLYVPTPLMLAWWVFAIGRYLKIPHSWLVPPLLMLLAAMIGEVFLFYAGETGTLLPFLWG